MSKVLMETVLTVSQGDFNLQRFPLQANQQLRAWDAADEYVLNVLEEQFQLSVESRILIINDSFGALAVALNFYQPQALSDSYISQLSTRKNLIANQLTIQRVRLWQSLQQPQGLFDVVIIKAPKTLALLEDQLIRLQTHLNAATQVIITGMIKNLPSAVWDLVERLIGKTTTSLAKKKARLIFARPDEYRNIPKNPYPSDYPLENTNYQISNHANVFSRQRLDIGTRFFIEHLPHSNQAQTVIDLACGNGILGLMYADKNPQAQLYFIDESFMAIASAKTNFERAFKQRKAVFKAGDALSDYPKNSTDLILCNPPFHQQNAIGDHIAYQMFKQSRQVLVKGGELWVIGNRHLGYYLTLKKLFNHVETVASNKKFVIVKAVNR